MAVQISTVKSYGTASVEQTLTTSVQPAVSITKTSANETGTITPANGSHSGLNASFEIQTNGNDDNYYYIVEAKALSTSGEVSAFGSNRELVFGNVNELPTPTAIEHAREGIAGNDNAIAYYTTMTITNPMTVRYESDYAEHENCWAINVNDTSVGTLNQQIGGTPVPNTYSKTCDMAGTYRVTVTLTAIGK